MTINRDLSVVASYTQTYAFPVAVREGSFPLSLVFYALPDGTGAAVAQSSTTAPLSVTAAALPSVALTDAITRVEIAAGQTVLAGQSAELTVTAYAGAQTVVPITAGSVFLTIGTGATLLTAGHGITIQGIHPGTAMVTAEIDGIRSAAAAIAITSNAIVAIAPATPPVLNVSNRAAFTATVTNAPETTVIWSVQEGAAGGSIDQKGVYTAPKTTGTYHIVATSVYDPTRRAVVSVVVANGSVTVGGEFPVRAASPQGAISPVRAASRRAEPFRRRAAWALPSSSEVVKEREE